VSTGLAIGTFEMAKASNKQHTSNEKREVAELDIWLRRLTGAQMQGGAPYTAKRACAWFLRVLHKTCRRL